MATSIPPNFNDKIKKKLLGLSENIRRNLLLASSDVQRKFILEERDLLAILVLAIQYLQKPSQPSSTPSSTSPSSLSTTPASSSPTTPVITTPKTEKEPQETALPTTDKTMGKSGGKTNNGSNNLDTTENLRKELLRILESTSFDSDAKSWLLLEAYNRYKNYTTLSKERHILDNHLKRHPNVLVGGGGGSSNDDITDSVNEHITNEKENDTNDENSTHTVKETDSKPGSSSTTTLTGNQRVTNEQPSNSPLQIWINDALKTITSFMKNKINVIFLENLQNHAYRLQNFLSSKGSFDKHTNRIIAPHNRFFLKKDSLYFKIKAIKGLQSFDLATLLACVSFSKSKLFRFLQYRFKKVKAFSRNEKHCLHIFLNTCPISKKRIPCSTIRNLANA